MKDQLRYDNYVAHYQADAELSDYFEEDAFEEQGNRRRYESLLNLCPLIPGQKVLEVGSGGGPGVEIIAAHQVKYFPLDIPVKNLKQLKKKAAFDFTPISGDVFHLPLRAGSAEVIILSEVLEHLEDPLPALAEINRVLADDGVLLISVPFKERISYQVCVHCNKLTPFNAHFHSFDIQKLKTLLANAGLSLKLHRTINNKIADRLHISILLKYFSFTLWRMIDGFFNTIIPKPSHLVCMVIKDI